MEALEYASFHVHIRANASLKPFHDGFWVNRPSGKHRAVDIPSRRVAAPPQGAT